MSHAKIICDSVSPMDIRLTTIEVTMHRFVLAEFNTHRVFSRNSASSRAIPFKKQLQKVNENPAVPVSFPANQKGMQGGEELTVFERQKAHEYWLEAKDRAVEQAQKLADLNVHKSVVNRLLEPFMWHTVIVTATDWQNFWGLRCNEQAQPEIRVAAEAMQQAYNESTPEFVDYGEWHLPYITIEDDADLDTLKMVSSARCARVSYLTHDGTRDMEKDIELFERLSSADPMHASPFEHVATPACTEYVAYGNFRGWNQFRHQFEKYKNGK